MKQSSFLVVALAAGFIFFLAARGRLTDYAKVLWGSTPAQDAVTKKDDKKNGNGHWYDDLVSGFEQWGKDALAAEAQDFMGG